ncbi:hypothetical protein EAH86_01665 [Pedococcus bigeumensis]|uniref:Glycosyltransferase RgtA/B/C/D-like domain-containing protein n=1 Tax=Pedococcus bigeumensis TaxID=433644 RepID=A0A502D4C1_9MICO|nr:hypothetical protein EAH86_01665 [Pedococcus bigeumensis]
MLTGGTVAAVAVFVGLGTLVGADCLWLVALGDHILREGSVPDGIPFAAAASAGWPNVLVLSEVLLALIHRLGGAPGLAVTQVVVDVLTLTLVALGARRLGATDRATAPVVVLVAAGAITSLVVVRVQLFSLVPFALLALLLREEHRRPSRRIWLLVPLVVLWSNLHGAVLLGVVVAGTYLVFSRLRSRPLESSAVGLVTLVALLATPAGPRTIQYYLGVMDNEAAARGSELWARPDLTRPFDLLLALAAVALIVLMARSRRPLWEWVAMIGLAVGTVTAARHGVWLLMLAAAPAARGLTRDPGRPEVVRWPGPRWSVAAAVVLVALAAVPWSRGAHTAPVDDAVVKLVAGTAGQRVVLAPEPMVESLAVAGVRVWLSDPVDAFGRSDQAAYLDFLEGSAAGRRALDAVEVVVVEDGSPPEGLVDTSGGWTLGGELEGWRVYTRR